jgi:3-methyladenine DNA glycosylase/8-oxoguanine DNA glycosylase
VTLSAAAPTDDVTGSDGPLVRVLDAPRELDLEATSSLLRTGPGDPTTAITRDEVWRAAWTRSGAATVRVLRHGGRLAAAAWGPGAAEALDRLPRLLGFDDDPSSFAPADPLVAELHRRRQGLRLPCTGAVVEALVPTIIEQKVSAVEAHRSWYRLVSRYGSPAPGPRPLMLPPQPVELARLPYTAFHPLGIERRRAEVIRRVCARCARLDRLGGDSPAEARRVLEHITGVGPWTSANVTLRSHGDPDAVIVGDYNLPSLVAWTLLGSRADRQRGDELMLELLEPYRGHRARVQVLLKHEGHHPPRHAPRARLRELRRM